MITAVADTNVIASGLVRRNPQSAPVQILDAWRDGAFTLVVSDYLLTELERTLWRLYFAARLCPEQVAAILWLVRTDARLTSLTAEVKGIATHPEDDSILGTALSGLADYLVTGGHQLKPSAPFRRLRS